MKEIDGGNFVLKLHDDLIKEVIVKKDRTFSLEDVKLSFELSDRENPGARYYTLVRGEEGSSVSSDARRAVASEQYNNRNAALALCQTNTAQKIGGNLFLKVNRPKVPTRFFEDDQKALEWLREVRKKEK